MLSVEQAAAFRYSTVHRCITGCTFKQGAAENGSGWLGSSSAPEGWSYSACGSPAPLLLLLIFLLKVACLARLKGPRTEQPWWAAWKGDGRLTGCAWWSVACCFLCLSGWSWLSTAGKLWLVLKPMKPELDTFCLVGGVWLPGELEVCVGTCKTQLVQANMLPSTETPTCRFSTGFHKHTRGPKIRASCCFPPTDGAESEHIWLAHLGLNLVFLCLSTVVTLQVNALVFVLAFLSSVRWLPKLVKIIEGNASVFIIVLFIHNQSASCLPHSREVMSLFPTRQFLCKTQMFSHG